MKQNIIIAVVVIALLAVGIYVFTQRSNNDSANNTNQTTNTPQEGDVVGGDFPTDPEGDPQTPTSDTIAVSTQLAGSNVTIDNVFLSKPGFIAIHEATPSGELGKSVGMSGYLSVGAKQDLEVPAQITAGGKYFAVVHVDDGDKKFNASTDKPAMKNDLPVQIMFSVSQ